MTCKQNLIYSDLTLFCWHHLQVVWSQFFTSKFICKIMKFCCVISFPIKPVVAAVWCVLKYLLLCIFNYGNMPQGRRQNFTHEINLCWNKCQIERWQNLQDSYSHGALKIACCVIIRSNSWLCKLLFITFPIILGHRKVIWSPEII